MTATKATTEQQANDEQTLRTRIAALDRKIEAQRRHIGKLEAELTTKRNERNDLVRQRIDLLQRELPTEEATDA